MDFKEYFNNFSKMVAYDKTIENKLSNLTNLFLETHKNGNKIIFVGNGGSAAMASHVSVDLTKNAKVRAINFNEADLITCLSNDRGYENWIVEALKMYADSGDVVVLISSSGRSPNIVNAAKWAIQDANNVTLVTVTGMNSDNPTKLTNDNGINLWADSRAYNLIEMTHHFWLLAIVDKIIGNAVYSA